MRFRIVTLASILFTMMSFSFCHASEPSENSDCSSDMNCAPYEDSVRGIIAKIYVNPARIFSQGGSYYLAINGQEAIPLVNLEQDLGGYFVQIDPNHVVNAQQGRLVEYASKTKPTSNCPLCGKSGYIAGICSNSACPGKENRRIYEEEQARKKEEHRKRKT